MGLELLSLEFLFSVLLKKGVGQSIGCKCVCLWFDCFGFLVPSLHFLEGWVFSYSSLSFSFPIGFSAMSLFDKWAPWSGSERYSGMKCCAWTLLVSRALRPVPRTGACHDIKLFQIGLGLDGLVRDGMAWAWYGMGKACKTTTGFELQVAGRNLISDAGVRRTGI